MADDRRRQEARKRLTWNAGRREWRGWKRAVSDLRKKSAAFSAREAKLRESYGTSPPDDVLREYVADAQHLKEEMQRVKHMRYEPFFPALVIEQIEDSLTVSLEDHPELLDELWQAVARLVERRQPCYRGKLSADERERLAAIKSLTTQLVKACDPVERTTRVIGGWAQGGLLNGLTLAQLLEAMGVLSAEIGKRLAQAGVPAPHRPRDVAFDAFCVSVVCALRRAGEPTQSSRVGSVARVLTVLFRASGQRVPKDLLRGVQKALRRAPAEERARRRRVGLLKRYLKISVQ